jgi:CDP-ribitol ribitolphosphotransferase
MYVIHPRPGTFRVQVWHAAGAFKKFGYSVLDRSFGADEALVERVPIHANYDLCLLSAAAIAPHYAEAFRVPLDRFTSGIGIPRTDLFLDEARRTRAEADVRRRYRIPAGRRVVLYAPTFRGDSVTAARDAELLDLRTLGDVIGDDHVVLLRLHPFIRQRATLDPDLAGFAIDVSDHPDINELMLVSDVLVTDYSSVIFEFALLGRPIALLAPDHDAYVGERGFYLDFPADMPGPVFETTTALAAYLRAGTFDTARVEAFARASFDLADGRASERFVDLVVRPALDGGQPTVRRVGR